MKIVYKLFGLFVFYIQVSLLGMDVDVVAPSNTNQLVNYLDGEAFCLLSESNGLDNHLAEVLVRVCALIDAGELLNPPDGLSPLYVVCLWQLRNYSLVPDQAVEYVVHLLLNKGADPNIPCNREVPLFLAVRCQLVNVVRMLLQYGARVNNVWGVSQDGRAVTPLHMAAACGDLEIFRLILREFLDKTDSTAPQAYSLSAATDGELQSLCDRFSHL